jgi:hypothetical protein
MKSMRFWLSALLSVVLAIAPATAVAGADRDAPGCACCAPVGGCPPPCCAPAPPPRSTSSSPAVPASNSTRGFLDVLSLPNTPALVPAMGFANPFEDAHQPIPGPVGVPIYARDCARLL